MDKEVTSNSSLIKFNEVDSHGNVFLPNSIKTDDLKKLKIRGNIEDFELNENGITVVKKMNIISGSI